MKRLLLSASIIAIFVFSFVSCYYDNEEALYPSLNSSCDTSNVTFSGTILTVLNNNCYSCHSNANAVFGGGIHLQSFADVAANSGKIIPAVNRTGSFPMPPAGKLDNCSINQLKIWVRNGTQNN